MSINVYEDVRFQNDVKIRIRLISWKISAIFTCGSAWTGNRVIKTGCAWTIRCTRHRCIRVWCWNSNARNNINFFCRFNKSYWFHEKKRIIFFRALRNLPKKINMIVFTLIWFYLGSHRLDFGLPIIRWIRVASL